VKNGEKSKAVTIAVSAIEKMFGKGAIMRLGGDDEIPPIAVVSTGSLGLDLALGAGGLPILVPFCAPGVADEYFSTLDGLVLSGGVAANSRLRAAFAAQAATYDDVEVFLPPPRLCTDNAAMIAVAGTEAFRRGERATLDLNADPAWRI